MGKHKQEKKKVEKEVEEDPMPPPTGTVTEQWHRAHKFCLKEVTYHCRHNLCPVYCRSKYPKKNRHKGLYEECKTACKDRLCTIKRSDFDPVLFEQTREQLKQCMKETKNYTKVLHLWPEEEQKWRRYRTKKFTHVETPIWKEKNRIDHERAEKQRKIIEAAEKEDKEFWDAAFKRDENSRVEEALSEES